MVFLLFINNSKIRHHDFITCFITKKVTIENNDVIDLYHKTLIKKQLSLLTYLEQVNLSIWTIQVLHYLRNKVKVWATSENPSTGGRLSKSLPH